MFRKSYTTPDHQLQLVFSDEFNTDGRTFYPGDDPFWEAVDLHYWAVSHCVCHVVGSLADRLHRQTTWSGMTLKQ